MLRSFRSAPRGRRVPCSQPRTMFALTLRNRAKSTWLALARAWISAPLSGDSVCAEACAPGCDARARACCVRGLRCARSGRNRAAWKIRAAAPNGDWVILFRGLIAKSFVLGSVARYLDGDRRDPYL